MALVKAGRGLIRDGWKQAVSLPREGAVGPERSRWRRDLCVRGLSLVRDPPGEGRGRSAPRTGSWMSEARGVTVPGHTHLQDQAA